MFFFTYPEAENKFLTALNPDGGRSWGWIELALHIPMYLVSGVVKTKDGSFGRDWLLGQLGDVLNLVNTPDEGLTNIEIGLLSPGHMNGTNSFQLGKIKEIWRHPTERSQLFVLADGKKLRYSLDEDSINEKEMELVLSL